MSAVSSSDALHSMTVALAGMGQDERHGNWRSWRLDRRHSRRQTTQGNPEEQHGHDPGMITQSQHNGVSVIQINLQHCKAASAALYKQIAGLDSVIC